MRTLAPVGTQVELQDYGLDKYGRTLGRIFQKEQDINLAMVESGWAIPYIICEGDSCTANFFTAQPVAQYLKSCKEAREKGLGVFNPKDPLKEMPFEFRLRMQHRKPDKFVGNFETKELYPPDQYRQVDVCQRIFFMKQSEAERVGYRIK